jgi:hypothetical protein
MIPRVPATILARLTIWTAGGFGLLQGVGIALGGYQRWSGPTYAMLRQIPGGPYTWGFGIAAAGAFILAGSALMRWKVKATGLVFMSFWSLVFALSSVQAIIHTPSAGTTAAPTYLYLCVSTLILVFVDESRLVAKDEVVVQ